MPFKPLLDRIVIKPIPKSETTRESGIIMPETVEDNELNRGTVIFVGPGTSDLPMILKPNDLIVYGSYAGEPIKIDGEEYTIMNQSAVYGIES